MVGDIVGNRLKPKAKEIRELMQIPYSIGIYGLEQR
jgi:hypothetical protein